MPTVKLSDVKTQYALRRPNGKFITVKRDSGDEDCAKYTHIGSSDHIDEAARFTGSISAKNWLRTHIEDMWVMVDASWPSNEIAKYAEALKTETVELTVTVETTLEWRN